MSKLLGDMSAKYCHGATFRRDVLNEPPSWESVWMFYDIKKEKDPSVKKLTWMSMSYPSDKLYGIVLHTQDDTVQRTLLCTNFMREM